MRSKVILMAGERVQSKKGWSEIRKGKRERFYYRGEQNVYLFCSSDMSHGIIPHSLKYSCLIISDL